MSANEQNLEPCLVSKIKVLVIHENPRCFEPQTVQCGAKHPFKNCGAEIVQILTLDQQPKYSRKVQHTFVLLIWGADFDDFGE